MINRHIETRIYGLVLLSCLGLLYVGCSGGSSLGSAVEGASDDDASRSAGPQTFPYTVQEGETLKNISRAFIVSVQDIREANNLGANEEPQAGMKIQIPPSEY